MAGCGYSAATNEIWMTYMGLTYTTGWLTSAYEKVSQKIWWRGRTRQMIVLKG